MKSWTSARIKILSSVSIIVALVLVLGTFQNCASDFDESNYAKSTAADGTNDGSSTGVPTAGADVTAPVVTFSKTPAKVTNRADASFVFSASDNSGVAPILTCKLDGVVVLPCESPLSTLALGGNHTLEVSAVDAAANSGKMTYEWNILSENIDFAPGALTLNVGERVANTRMVLYLDTDGVLKIYSLLSNGVVWAVGSGGVKAVFQPDGNFVLYNANNIAVWSTGTTPRKVVVGSNPRVPTYATITATRLSLQSDGNLVIYGNSSAGPTGIVMSSANTTGK